MIVRHGYYLAATDSIHGDLLLAEGCRRFWLDLGLGSGHVGRFDGVSWWQDGWKIPERTEVVRLTVGNFFDPEKPGVPVTHDIYNGPFVPETESQARQRRSPQAIPQEKK